MKINIAELLLFFDKLAPPTNQEQGVYWFQSQRSDFLVITLACCVYENYVDIIISNNFKTGISSISLENCSEIRILDQKLKCLEVLHENGKGRCFLSLLGESILDYCE